MEGCLPNNRLMGLNRWMGSHFRDWIEYNRVALSTQELKWGHKFRLRVPHWKFKNLKTARTTEMRLRLENNYCLKGLDCI